MALLRWVRALLLSALVIGAHALGVPPTEYEIKAVFLLHFSRFVEWPDTAFASLDEPFVVCIVGYDPFGSALDEVVKGEKVDQRPITVRRIEHVGSTDACHILFVHRSEDARLPEILAAVDHRSTLTVTDSVRRARRGEVIRLVTDHDRVRLRIDVGAARAARLTISSNLLRAAEVVGSSRS